MGASETQSDLFTHKLDFHTVALEHINIAFSSQRIFVYENLQSFVWLKNSYPNTGCLKKIVRSLIKC